MSEYTRRYEHVSHEELYQGVNAGDPAQIEGLSARWTSLKGTLDDLARDLTADLDALAKTWTGDASREFQRRLTMVAGYSGNLAEGMTGIRQALDMMAGDLRAAQAEAESPEKTDDNDKLLSGAGKGFLLGGGPGAVIGGIIGHQQDEAEQKKAHQRMVQVVAKLAEGYDFSAYGRVVAPEPPGSELPGHHTPKDPTLHDGPSVRTPSSGPGLGSFGPGAHGTATTSGVHHTAPTSGTPGDGAPGGGNPGGHPGAGAPGSVTTGGTVDPSGTSLAGAGPLTTAPGGPAIGGGPGFGPGGANPTVTAGGGGLFGGPGVLSTGSLAGTGSNAVAGRFGGVPGAESRSAAGTGRLTSGRGLGVDTEGRSTGRTGGRPAMAGRNGVLGARGNSDDDESEGRLTWLLEDEMVWGDGRAAPPPVLDGH
ncbi:WXG100 family type VII secretion target [Micromonospora schwarzwaldensis]|uniref:WXG100 family type VII secretion target n=1 Tax=Micromonospora sp. DSM 45708 TaxID=3111767 RepID=UPI0031D78DEB